MQNGRGRIQGLPEFKRSTARAELSPAWQTNNDFWGPTCSISSKEPTTDKVTVCMSCIKLFLLNTVWKRMFLYKWPLYDFFWPFFAICMSNFHKTEALTVILRCLTGLNYDCFKRYDTKRKYFHFFFSAILYKNRRFRLLHFLHFCVFCHNFCTN